MNKNFILIILLISLFLFGCLTPESEGENMHADGLIFVAVPSKANSYYKPFFKDIFSFHKQFQSKQIKGDKLFILSYEESAYDDIWIRDVAPVATTRLVKFVYGPKYLPKDVSLSLNNSFTNWLSDNKFEVVYSPLVLDGGNLIWNKKDTIILTNRILTDNPKLNKDEIIAQLMADLGVSKVILIPPETGDVLAHADGMVKFINENTMFISDFLGDEDFRQKVEKIILKEMPNAKFIVIPSAYTEQGQYDNKIASAKGLYINMLETDKALYVPEFQLPEDEEMVIFIKKHVAKPVIALELEALSTMGGAVNCLTWYCPNKFLPANF